MSAGFWAEVTALECEAWSLECMMNTTLEQRGGDRGSDTGPESQYTGQAMVSGVKIIRTWPSHAWVQAVQAGVGGENGSETGCAGRGGREKWD